MPFTTLKRRLGLLANANPHTLLQGRLLGLEREALRVAADGHIAQTPHSRILGATLTHPLITTDYSEALLEFITPPLPDAESVLNCLGEIQRFVYPQLGTELLWAGSMPCIVAGESSIPIAEYGSSNLGKMKHIYRRGLAWRYGRIMQVIAGIHFNFSLPEQFWQFWHTAEGRGATVQEDRSAAYFGMIRNLQRYGWLILYLCGASPAICKSFLDGKTSDLALLNANSCYGAYATSLRMSNVGYNNRSEKKSGVNVCYNSLPTYISSLRQATETPWPPYQRIGVKVDGEYRQLNANILQIENEYYASMRPKQPPQGNEKPSSALRERGVGYVELRSLDINPLLPLGVSANQLRFVEAFLLLCLLTNAPPLDAEERRMIDDNQMATAMRGRDPALILQRRHAAPIALRTWASELLEELQPVCALLDSGCGEDLYAAALLEQQALVADPERTPSARILAALRTTGEDFFSYTKRLSAQHREWFMAAPLAPEREQFFRALAQQSLEQQQQLEAADTLTFEDFLDSYFAQA